MAPALAFVALQLLGRAALGAPDLAGALEGLAVRIVPGALFSWVLDHLLFLAKPLLYGVLLLGEAIVLTLAARAGRPARAGAVLLAGGALAGIGQGAAYYASLAVAAGAYAALLARRPPPSGRGISRRDFLVAGVAGLAAVALARRVMGPLMVPAFLRARHTAASGPSAGMPPLVTSASDFYVVTKNLTDPVVDEATWRLRVHGLVERPLRLAYEDVLAMPAQEVYRTLECISNPVGSFLISTGRFTGITLGDLLDRAGVRPGATHLRFTSADAYFETMTLQQARSPLTLLAYGLDGSPLPVEHGFPLRVLGAGTYGMKNPKWLTDIEVVASASPTGFWEQLGWSRQAVVRTMSEIKVPLDGASLPAAKPFGVGGVAFAGDRGIERVELSLDGGQTWQETRLQGGLGPSTWVLWQYLWQDPAPGTHTLSVRATDGQGETQPRAIFPPFPYGAMGLHTIRVHVT
jgi:DMSO/TMAO reductase YedYZ molybdopterin-dependent catalytic subunit